MQFVALVLLLVIPILWCVLRVLKIEETLRQNITGEPHDGARGLRLFYLRSISKNAGWLATR